MGPDDAFWRREAETLYQLLFPVVEQRSAEAVHAGWEMLEVDLDVNWALVNETARQWARSYTFELVRGVTATTQAIYQEQFETWIASGAPLDELITSLEPYLGEVRAEAVAVTETTRIYAEGNLLAWRVSDVVDGVRWMTAEDADVCELCDPLDGLAASLEALDFQGAWQGGPPRHVRCRCWLVPLVALAKWWTHWRGRGEFEAGKRALPEWLEQQAA